MAGFLDLLDEAMPYLATEDIYATAGTSWAWTYSLTDDAGAPVDFSGVTGICQLKVYLGGPPVLSPVVDFPAPGVVRVSATPAQTAALTAGKYLHEVELTKGTDVIKVVGSGDSTVIVKPEVI